MFEMTLRGVIGDEITAAGVEALLAEANGDDVYIKLNSPGGAVFEGYEIYNMILDYPGHVSIEVTALAASMASVVLMAANERIGRTASEVMIHDAWTIAIGNAAGLREVADVLEALSTSMAGIYARHTNETVDYWLGVMQKDSYFRGEEAVGIGLFSRIHENDTEGVRAESTATRPAPVAVVQSKSGVEAMVAAVRLRRRIVDNGNARP